MTYCPAGLTCEEVESVGFRYGDLDGMIARYDPAKLRDGYNTVAGEDIFYVSNPGLGLWATVDRYQEEC